MSHRRTALVIGASGQVGRHTSAALARHGWEVIGTGHTRTGNALAPLDIEDEDRVAAIVRETRPSVCVVSAAMTNVEGCEADPARAAALNTKAPAIAAHVCRDVGAKVILLSSEYVFDGRSGPYAEGDETAPLSVYGRTKRDAELAVLGESSDNLVVRTTVVFSHAPGDRNFVMQLRDRLARGEAMRVPIDQVSSPTYAPWLGEVIALVQGTAAGVLHVAGPEVLDRHAFATRVALCLGLDASLLEPVATSELGQVARRPLRAGLRIDRLASLGICPPPLAESLADVARAAVR